MLQTSTVALVGGQAVEGDEPPPDVSRGAFAEDVVKCPVTGCSNHTLVVATAQGNPRGIAVDQSAVYWANDGLDAVMKSAK